MDLEKMSPYLSVIVTWSSSWHPYGRISYPTPNRIITAYINGGFAHLSYSVRIYEFKVLSF